MKITLWDGQSDVQGIAAAHLHDAYPLPDGGSLALVWSDDETRLLQVQDRLPVGGNVAITEANLEQLLQILTEQQGTPAPDVIERLDGLQEQIDDVTAMLLEG